VYTFVEYVMHRFFMHDPRSRFGRKHLTHHAHTKKDMSLNTKGADYAELEHEGLYLYGVLSFGPMLICASFLMLVLVFGLGTAPMPAFVVQLIFAAWQTCAWNTMHAVMHGRCAYTEGQPLGLTYGMAERLADLPYFNWIVRNHIQHHDVKGEERGNFNIVWPGADFLFGTYHSCSKVEIYFPPLEPSPENQKRGKW